jgi:hypothetical protein
MRVLAAIVGWIGLSVFAGTMLAALGAGSLSPVWVGFSSGFCALFFTPVLLTASKED